MTLSGETEMNSTLSFSKGNSVPSKLNDSNFQRLRVQPSLKFSSLTDYHGAALHQKITPFSDGSPRDLDLLRASCTPLPPTC